MSADLILIGVILLYGLFGALRGGIKSIGGLISMCLSFVLSRALAVPVTERIFALTSLEDKIEYYLSAARQGVIQSNDIINIGIPVINTSPISDSVDGFMRSVTGVFSVTAINIASIVTALILFAIFMFIFGIVITNFNTLFETLPLGKTINTVFGFVCGVIKGVIVALLLYYLFVCINRLCGSTIPLSSGLLSNIIQNLPEIHLLR